MSYHSISEKDLARFSVANNYNGNMSLNFGSTTGTTLNINLSLKDSIDLACMLRNHIVECITENPLEASQESDDILLRLSDLFDNDEVFMNCYNFDQVENLTNYLFNGCEYKCGRESDDEYSNDSEESEKESDEN